MLRKSFLIATLIIFCNPFILSQNKKLTLENIFDSEIFDSKNVENIQWLPDGSAFTFTKKNSQNNLNDIYKHEVFSGKEELLVSSNKLIYDGFPIQMSSYSWTSDGKYLLIAGPVVSIWRHSIQAPYYLYEIETKKILALSNNNPHLRNVKLSPDGKWVGFVRDHNIFIVELATDEETQLTEDGSENILNGEFDWVYEEEFSISDGWQWSLDSKKIAFWKFDQSRVNNFYLIDEMDIYNRVYMLKYPKAGEQNSIVKIGVIDIEEDETNWMNLGENDDIYIPRIFWTNSS
ncbi:MAG: DPP IV N-terminal domain-containing protein, partial [Ignavibacteriaceae bacterium]